MDIHSAAYYLKMGYHIRRSCWESEEFLEDVCGLNKRKFIHLPIWDHEAGKAVVHSKLVDEAMDIISVDDLLATDWEIIIDGIDTYFNSSNRVSYR